MDGMTEPSLELPEPTPTTDPAATAETGDAAATASPAAGSNSLVLEAPGPVGPVAPARAEDAVPIPAADQAKLDSMVASYLDAVTALDPHSQAFADKVRDVGQLGDDDLRASAGVSNRLLQKPLAAMQGGGLTEASTVGRSLRDLRQEVEDLDPSRQGDLLSPKKLLGILPFGAGDRLRDYFDKYQSSQHHIDAIITALYHGQDELQRDNAAIEQEKVNLWAIDGPAAPVRLSRAAPRRRADRPDRRDRGDRPGAGEGPQGGHALLRPAEAPGPAHPARGQRPGLSRARRDPAQQPRADQGRRSARPRPRSRRCARR